MGCINTESVNSLHLNIKREFCDKQTRKFPAIEGGTAYLHFWGASFLYIYIYTQCTWIVNKIPVQCPPLFLFKPDKMLVISVLILTYVYLRVKPVSWIQYGQRLDMTHCYEMS